MRWCWLMLGALAAPAAAESPLDDLIAMGRFEGVALVRQADGAVWSRAHGAADGERPNGVDVAYPLGSIAKPMTALAAMSLVADGRLDLDAPVEAVLPALAGRPAAAVTVRQLLSHTSGIPGILQNGQGLDAEAQLAALHLPLPREALLSQFVDAPLRFEPGARYAYSNSNYVLLAMAVEAAAGVPYAEAVSARVFAPAGMAACVACPGLDGVAAARAHERADDGARTPMPVPHPDRLFGAGSLWATPAALLALGDALAGGGLLPEPAQAAMRAAVAPTGRDGERAALGWTLQDVGGATWLVHGGALPGLVAQFAVQPETGAVVVAVRNATWPLDRLDHEQARVGELASALMARAVGADAPAMPRLASADLAAGWAGRWRLEDGRAFELRPDGPHALRVLPEGDWSPHALVQESPLRTPEAASVEALIDDWRADARRLWDRFDPAMRSALTPAALADAFAGLEAAHGPLRAHWLYAIDGPRQQLRLRFEGAAVDVSLIRDEEDRIAGLRLDGVETGAPPAQARIWPLADGDALLDQDRLGRDDLRWRLRPDGGGERLVLDADGRLLARRDGP